MDAVVHTMSGDTQDLQFLESFAVHRWALGFAAVCVYNSYATWRVCVCE